jgi:hypothetical protein
MVYLMTLAIISLVFGLLLIFTPKLLLNIGNVANSVVLYLDEKLQPMRVVVGIFLVLVAAWLIYVVVKYPELSYLNALWLISLGFGLMFLFFPNWLSWLSNVSNKVVFSTDDVVIGARKIIGVVLVIASVYIFYGAYIVR